eukprot:CAMPEP_0202458456 /NCGR_PEP_ID=MMETSP1360-20130828/25498_1 /ASSEMBLY_ACC=CAM_ASM_000848 /TAXON_ID=515479 /ORGANISM="Licmophora paradoxa, Strain CCMP2313" /LENGTH=115 /DNA_ID=CAMNT_0049079007 /DNA_START=119 /DNA_END=466 /DNA_ORIENTATION=-
MNIHSMPSMPLWFPADTMLPDLDMEFSEAESDTCVRSSTDTESFEEIKQNKDFQTFLSTASKNQGSFARALAERTKRGSSATSTTKDQSHHNSAVRRSLVGFLLEPVSNSRAKAA